jgi:hypothetical protein
MKQHITAEQLNELSNKGREKFQKWFWNRQGIISFEHHKDNGRTFLKAVPASKAPVNPENITIGIMIEFLANGRRSYYLPGCSTGESEIDPETWCDELWQAAKECLEN